MLRLEIMEKELEDAHASWLFQVRLPADSFVPFSDFFLLESKHIKSHEKLLPGTQAKQRVLFSSVVPREPLLYGGSLRAKEFLPACSSPGELASGAILR